MLEFAIVAIYGSSECSHPIVNIEKKYKNSVIQLWMLTLLKFAVFALDRDFSFLPAIMNIDVISSIK